MDFSKRMQPVKKYSVFGLEKEECLVWCGTITRADDGLFYLYFSFWPRDKGHKAWVTHSKIGFAVADDSLGPFRYKGIALAGAGGCEWDRDCVHNPAVLKVNGIYYLYYMGNYGDGSYWDHRNHQRIGVAFSDKPEGPFKRLDKPIIDITPGTHDALMTSNPTVCIGGDNRIYMIYKAVSDQGEMPKGGAVVCGMAVADHPLGPFIKHPEPILANPQHSWSVEDPFLWYENDRFYLLAKDYQGYFTKAGADSMALFESKDGFEWNVSDTPLAFQTQICWENGDIEGLQCMERPQMWLDETGRPKVLSCVCVRQNDKDRLHSFNIQIGID